MRMKSCAPRPWNTSPRPCSSPGIWCQAAPSWRWVERVCLPIISRGFWRMGDMGYGELDIRNGGITDQRVPLSSWMRSFRGRQKSCFPAHMLPAAPIYQGVRRLPGCAQSEHHAGAPCNRMHSFGKQLSVVEEVKRKENVMQCEETILCIYHCYLVSLCLHFFVRTKCLGLHKRLCKVIRKLPSCGFFMSGIARVSVSSTQVNCGSATSVCSPVGNWFSITKKGLTFILHPGIWILKMSFVHVNGVRHWLNVFVRVWVCVCICVHCCREFNGCRVLKAPSAEQFLGTVHFVQFWGPKSPQVHKLI